MDELPIQAQLYLICVLTDFATFVVVFAVSRGLAEGHAEPWYLGVAGAGLSLSAGVGSVLGGWLAHRFEGRVTFVSGAMAISTSIAAGMAIGTIAGGMAGTLVNHRVPYALAAAAILLLIVAQFSAWRSWVLPLRRCSPEPAAETGSETA